MPAESITQNEFVDATVGMNIPKNFIPAIEKVIVYYVIACYCYLLICCCCYCCLVDVINISI